MEKIIEILNLTKLEEDIIMNGKLHMMEDEYLSCEYKDSDDKRLDIYRFNELQEKYTYGFYFKDDIYSQLQDIETFKIYIINNYKEDKHD